MHCFPILSVLLDISKGSRTNLLNFYVKYVAKFKNIFGNYGIIHHKKKWKKKNPYLSYLFCSHILPQAHFFLIWPKDKTNATYKPQTCNKEELQQRNRLGTVSKKTTRGGAGEVGGGRSGLKQILLARSLTLNSEAAPDYIYMFGPHMGPRPYLWNITVKHI